MPTFARNHCQSRKKVCILCMQKSKEAITPGALKRIENLISDVIDFHDARVPQGICTTCRVSLIKREKSELADAPQLQLFNFSSIFVPRFTRSSPLSCNCTICKIARSGAKNSKTLKHPLHLKPKRRGRPGSSKPKDLQDRQQSSVPSVEKHCPQCLCVIGRGKRHRCSDQTLSENVLLLAEKYPKAAEKLASSIIKEKKPSPGGTVRLSQLAGPAFPVLPGSSKSIHLPASSISASTLINIQQKTNLSNTGVRKLATSLNKSKENVKVEKYFQEKLAMEGTKLKDFMVAQDEEFLSKGKTSERTLVYCPNVEELIWHILKVRGSSHQDSLIKISLDAGGTFLKVCLQVLNFSLESEAPGKENSDFLASGVKKLFIIALVEDISENHFNISKIFELMDLENIHFKFVCDLKVANILCGLQSHASKHPCCFCDVTKDELHKRGNLRTFGSLRQNFEAFKSSKSSLASDFFNCHEKPILPHEDDTEVLNVIPPPELHLMLGAVNHLFQGMKRVWELADLWPEQLSIKPAPYHGGHNFNGPACHKLLQNVDQLEVIAQRRSSFEVQPFVQAFRDFKAVVHSCFGNELSQDYATQIEQFKKSCINLPITITPKLHIIFQHIPEFIERNKVALGIFSEQALESAHSDYQSFWETRFKRQLFHPEYCEQLLKSVVEYNSKHL